MELSGKIKNHGHKPSLLPYLDAGNGRFYIKFSLVSQDEIVLEKTALPFLVIEDTDPLAHLIEAQFLTDAESELKKAFILIQRNQYLLARDALWPVTNLDVENCWQKAFSFYVEEKQDRFLVLLKNQINEKGRLTLLQPLFLCKFKNIFFHPPCPRCGLSLEQCEDDDLLISSGLRPYSRSLKRYLFCPSCASAGTGNFYVYEADHADPPGLKDRYTLIKEFGLLDRGSHPASQFPCSECQQNHECYGPGNAVLSRVVPLSFYPFYMLVFEAMSVNAVDFLSLISGAQFDELETHLAARRELGRINCLKAVRQNDSMMTPLFYDRSERHFLEILYLKLSFLGEVFKSLLGSTDLFKHPDLRVSIDRIWVKFAYHGSLLPFFWNFRIQFIDIIRPLLEGQPHQKLPSQSFLYFLGLVWFYSLLVNKKQDISMISQTLKEAADHSFSDPDFQPENFIKERLGTTFSPANTFWDPDDKTVPTSWYHIWEKSLALGWNLLGMGFQYQPHWSQEAFWQQFLSLREGVKETLFQGESIEPSLKYPLEQVVPREDEVIHDILVRIRNKWQSTAKPEKEEFPDTVILSVTGSAKRPVSPPLQQEEALKETVIINPECLKERSGPASVKEEAELGKTVILSAGDEQEEKVTAPLQRGKEAEDIPDTVIISTQGIKKSDPEKKGGKKPEEIDLMTETIILGPQRTEDRKKK